MAMKPFINWWLIACWGVIGGGIGFIAPDVIRWVMQ